MLSGNALQKRLKEAGINQSQIARHFGVTPVSVHKWVRNGVPAERVFRFERLTEIPARELRPDMFEGESDEPNREIADASV